MARDRSPNRRDAAVERERRERERRERARRRSTGQVAVRERPARPARADRSDASAPRAAASGAAVRERHEGLVGWIVRQVASLPTTIMSLPRLVVAILRGFALEVVAVIGGIGRAVLGVLPGSGRVATASRSVVGQARASATKVLDGAPELDAPRARRAPRSAAQQRAALERRARLRSRLRLAFAAVVLAAVVVGWIVVPASDAFRIRHLEVTGAGAVSDLEVRERIDTLLEGKTVFTVGEDAVAKQIEELPFVRDVRVERHLPGGLQLHVTEYRPLALGFGDGRFWLLARDGRVLAKANRDDWSGRIPTVTLRDSKIEPGDHVNDEPALRLLAARSSDSTLEFETIKADEYSITARLSNGTEVRFGRPIALTQKLLVAEAMLRQAARKDLEPLYIDVTVPGKPAFCATSVVACGMARGAAASATASDAKPGTDAEEAATTTPAPLVDGADALAATEADAG